jgi:hypothetical protein
MFLCNNQLKIVDFYKPWSNMTILMLFHDFDVICLLFHDFDVINLSIIWYYIFKTYHLGITRSLKMILNMNGLNIPDNQKPLIEEEQTMLWSNKLDKRKHNDQQILYMVLNRNYMIDRNGFWLSGIFKPFILRIIFKLRVIPKW